ncbi:alpha/beta hydrolase-fold protein [Pseudoalteromonas tunicata]|uniref:alpha/beta hydrolase-fold protein n=1 Tax=Pseudoalteromonas tunicata TaxID=314281 RepID=UPI00273ED34A|nr:alpha/beta hydrolase-fold protein [Pseudoalteromonas tunicata]MDP4983833.1 alpha/beta hydrolase-fold protein [Pseudoalteromonas tunicata]
MKLKLVVLLLVGLFLLPKHGYGAVAKELRFSSQALAEPYVFSVLLPNDYDGARKTPYPLLVTTAGDSRIAVLEAQIDWLSHVSFGPMPQVVILRLPQFVKANSSAMQAGLTAQLFHQQLLPFLQGALNLAPFTLIEGFSTQGNLALELFSQYPTHYQAAVISSPALELQSAKWHQQLNQQLQAHLAQRSLFLSLGTFTGNRPYFASLQVSLSEYKTAIFNDLSGENYISNPVIHFEQAVKQLFSAIHITNFQPFAQQGVAAVLAYQQGLKRQYGFEWPPFENLAGLANYYFDHQQPKEGVAVFDYLVTQYPEKLLYLIRYAQALVKLGDISKAKIKLEQVIALAKQQHDDEALQYSQNLLMELNQSN